MTASPFQVRAHQCLTDLLYLFWCPSRGSRYVELASGWRLHPRLRLATEHRYLLGWYRTTRRSSSAQHIFGDPLTQVFVRHAHLPGSAGTTLNQRLHLLLFGGRKRGTGRAWWVLLNPLLDRPGHV